MAIPRISLNLINLVNRADAAWLEQALDDWGFVVFQLDGQHVAARDELFAQMATTLSLPSGYEIRTWHGLQDHLWGKLCQVDAEDVALIWRDAHKMLDGGLGDLLSAASVLEETARNVYNSSESSFPHEMHFYVFLVGEGSNFPSFPPAE